MKHHAKNASSECPILLITQQKSGSMFLMHTLSDQLGYKELYIHKNDFPNFELVEEHVKAFALGRCISQNHMMPYYDSIRLLIQNGVSKAVVHLRDPRQALLSWVHWVNGCYERGEKENYELHYPPLPKRYFRWNIKKQIQWQIENKYALYVEFATRWLALSQDNASEFKILITKYQTMRNSPEQIFEQILAFYNLDKKVVVPSREAVKEKSRLMHYRKGEENEWARIFSKKQVEMTSCLLPEKIKRQMGWLA